MSSKLLSRWRLSQRSADLRRCGSCSLRGSAIVGQQPGPLRTEVNQSIRDLMATQIHMCNSPGRQCQRHRQELLCQSQSRRGRGRQAHRQGRGTRHQWCRALSMMPAKSHSALAEGFGRTAREMAALRRRRAIWIEFPPAMRGFRRQMLPASTGGDVCRGCWWSGVPHSRYSEL